MSYSFAVIGLGRVGGAMLSLLEDAGHSPVWAVSSGDSRPGVEMFREIPGDPGEAEVVFLAVPDSAIRPVAEKISDLWGETGCRGIVIFHFSGLFTSDELERPAALGAETASLHPLQSIMDKNNARESLKSSYFTCEGSEKAFGAARHIVESIGSQLIPISREDKVLYHAAAVIASNYPVSLISQSLELMSEVGLDLEHVLPLARGTLSNIESYGTDALTGPVRRGDWKTVEAHLDALYDRFPDIYSPYLSMGKYTSRVAGTDWPKDLGRRKAVLGLEELSARVRAMKKRRMKIVFTNGCFDILHAGHVTYLEKARSLGDCLVVGMNSDASVRRLKGENRPVNSEGARSCVLSALGCVDYVCLFGDDTPLSLIETLAPDVLVKGGDWSVEDIVGGDFVSSYGGTVCSIEFEEGFSSTSVIEKIRNT